MSARQMKRAADACNVEAYSERLNTGSRRLCRSVWRYVRDNTQSHRSPDTDKDTDTKIHRPSLHAVVESLARLFQVHHLNLQISCEIIYIFSFYCLGFAFASALPRFAWPLGLVSAEVVVYFFYKIKLAPS